MRNCITPIMTFLIATFICVGPIRSSWADTTVVETSCEYLADPLGIDVPQPRFTWVLQSDRRGTMQQAYQVLVAGSEEQLANNVGDLWDSGKVESDESVNIEYQGKKLASLQPCFWKVRFWDDQGQASPWSKPATFEMGLLEPSDWHGQWIGLGGEKNKYLSSLLRKEFVLGGSVKRARLYAAGIGWSEYYLNGKRVGKNVLDPATTDYDKRILYVIHDVTKLLQPGKNALGAMLGNGWYSEPVARNYGDRPQLLVELVVEMADGTVRRIASDESWRASTGPIVKNDMFGGEVYDARLEKAGWTEPGYGDASWPTATVMKSPGGRLEAQMIEPIRVNCVMKPVKITNPKPGVYVYDFGRYFAGWARLRVKGSEGTKLALRYGTCLFPDADVAEMKKIIDRDVRAGHATRVDPFPGLVDKRHHHGSDGATDYYILKGDPAGEVYEPRFTFHPVRYVQVEGFPGKPTMENLEGCVVHSSVDMTGDFQCSNPLLNQIHRNCVWTFMNEMYGIELDCVYREHWGWLEPASTPATFFARKYIPRFFTKYLRDAQCAQHSNGIIPDVIPAYPYKNRKTGDPAWAGNYPLAVWYTYQYYNDRRLLEQHYESMKRWVNYLTSRAKGHLIDGFYYGDHMLPGDAPGKEEFISKETPPSLLWTGYYYKNALILAQAARILGKTDDANDYDRLAKKIRDALNEKWLDTTRRCYAAGSQTSNIFALAMGVVPEADREGVLQNLTADILEKRSGHLHTGNLGTACVMDALAALGGGETLYRVATSRDYPGWGYMVDQGATTIWEAWGGIKDGFIGRNTSEDSMPMFMTIEEFFYNDLAGIVGPDYFGNRTISPGFRDIIIRPCVLGDLANADAKIRTVRGIVGVEWKREKDGVILKATIPVNARAKISIPKLGMKRPFIEEQGKRVWENGAYCSGVSGIVGGTEEEAFVTLDVGSGKYSFVLREGTENETEK
ncbi:MAG: family 78 glycoside hydrolase catalytic domain [Pirellulales bacterium]|nr:family 78 glycoside hydrolase catalytic domain [Pirellulales bacterium]